MVQSQHGTERAPVLAKDLDTSHGGLKLDGTGQLHRQGGTGQVANCPPVWVRSLYCWQSKHMKGGKENFMLSPRRMWDREKYHTGCEIQKFRKMALLVSVKLEVANLREAQGATMQRKKTRSGHLSECDTSMTSKWQKFPRWRCYCFERNYLLQGSSNPPNHLCLNVLFLSTSIYLKSICIQITETWTHGN